MGMLASIRGHIRCRVLVLYRADPEAVARLLPRPLEPATTRGRSLVGVCYTRMRDHRPGWLPLSMGDDHLAWRIPARVVQEDGEARPLVWVPRRDTSSWFEARCAGRLARRNWKLADFRFEESPGGVSLDVRTEGKPDLILRAEVVEHLESEAFDNVSAAREELSSMGAPRPPFALAPGFDQLELGPETWQVQPLAVRELEAPHFEDPDLFPEGSIDFDCALRLDTTVSSRAPAYAGFFSAAESAPPVGCLTV